MFALALTPLELFAMDAQSLGKVWTDEFSLSTRFNTLAASAVNASQPINIDGDSDFICQMINLTSYTAAGTILANPDYLIQISDGNRTLFDTTQHVMNVTGQNRNSGAMPFKLPMSKLFRGGAAISVTLTNNTATAAVVDVSLIGFKVYYNDQWTRRQIFGIA